MLFLFFGHQKRTSWVGKQGTSVVGVLRPDLQDEPMLARKQHHGSGDPGGMLVRREAINTGGLEARPRQQILGLAGELSDGNPGFGHTHIN